MAIRCYGKTRQFLNSAVERGSGRTPGAWGLKRARPLGTHQTPHHERLGTVCLQRDSGKNKPSAPLQILFIFDPLHFNRQR